MTLLQLRSLVESEPRSNDNKEIKVWLPGSRVSLTGFNGVAAFIHLRDEPILVLEGNIDSGSALDAG